MKYNNIIEFLIENLRVISKEEILPKFRTNLSIEVKSHHTDLVTEVDLAVEKRLTKLIKNSYKEALVIGEEAVAADSKVLDVIQTENLIFVIDPIDGTYCFSKGLSTFGIIVSVIKNNEVLIGVHYDPVNDDFIVAEKGSGSFYISKDNQEKLLSVSNEDNLKRMNGFVPYYIFEYKYNKVIAQNIINTFLEFERINSLRCSLHEYNQLAWGNCEFSLSTHTNVWDHGAGQLILEEANGVSGILGEGVGTYSPNLRKGFLLSANNHETWERVNQIFLQALNSGDYM